MDQPAAPPPTATTERNGKRRRYLIGAAVIVVLLALWARPTPQATPRGEKVTYSELVAALGDSPQRVWLDDGANLLIVDTGDRVIEANFPVGAVRDVLAVLDDQVAAGTVDVVPARGPSMIPSLILTLLPVGLILAFFWLLSKRGGAAGIGSALALNRSKTSPVDVPTTRFADVAGIDDALGDLQEVVEFLHNPERFRRLGATRPRGFLLVGPPGTGKTLLARAVAGEAGVPFYALNGSDFVELFAGLGASRVRDLFAKVRAQDKAIVFIDEIDAVAKARGRGALSGANDERENTLNALLTELDGFARHDGIIILGATNRVDVLDPALLRPGRFDRTITVPTPDRAGRQRIFELYAAKRPVDPTIDWSAIARRTPGMSGASIEALLNEAALEAARRGLDLIDGDCVESALATTVLGRERRHAVVSDRDRRIIAWHESGHAVAALLLPDADDPATVTIVPRGGTGGATWMSGNDHDLLTRSQALARLQVTMAGRAAEELLLDGDHTQGAHGDLSAATDLATAMIARFGMGRRLVSVGDDRLSFDGPTTAAIDAEVAELIGAALDQVRQLLAGRRALLGAVADNLLEEETLDVADLRLIDEQTRDADQVR